MKTNKSKTVLLQNQDELATKEVKRGIRTIELVQESNEKGKSLLRLAHSLVNKQQETSSVTAMHLSLSDEMHSYNLEDQERKRFTPILEESRLLQQEITTIFKATIDIETDIADTRRRVAEAVWRSRSRLGIRRFPPSARCARSFLRIIQRGWPDLNPTIPR